MFPLITVTAEMLEQFFGLKPGDFVLNSRLPENFFNDIQRTMDIAGLEMMQLFLLSAWKSIYQGDKGDPSVLADYRFRRYKQQIGKMAFLFDCCDTLTYAERQQRAFERQIITNGRKTPDFFPGGAPASFFKRLYELKIQHGFYLCNLSKEACIDGYQWLFDSCRFQPIPAMLLPVVLTIFSTDEKGFSNIYSYFKYKNRRFSKETQKQIIALFSDICKEVRSQFPCVDGFIIPIFRWPDIEAAFCRQRNLFAADTETAKGFFAEYRQRNDLSKAEEMRLMEHSYGADIRALAKLCNLNTYITMNCLPTDAVPAKAKKPLKLLTEGELLPERPGTKGFDYFDRYFDGMYQQLPAVPGFSQLALIRYYRLPLDSYLNADPDFFADIEESASSALSGYMEMLRHNYWLEHSVFRFEDGKEYDWLNRRLKARIQYKLGNLPAWQKYIKHAKSFACDIVSVFTKEDYKGFIGNPQNFHVQYFPLYLRQFCKKYFILEYENASDQEACFLEDEAFYAILDMIQNCLLENLYTFWHNAVAKELYT